MSKRGEPAPRPAKTDEWRIMLATVQVKGQTLAQWQFEITGAGRVWYAPDDDRKTVWIIVASTGHPKQTE
jgi:hypothetical protein